MLSSEVNDTHCIDSGTSRSTERLRAGLCTSEPRPVDALPFSFMVTRELGWCCQFPPFDPCTGFFGRRLRDLDQTPCRKLLGSVRTSLEAKAVILRVCQHQTCVAQGARRTLDYALLLHALWRALRKDWQVEACSCLGACGAGPNALVFAAGSSRASAPRQPTRRPCAAPRLLRGVRGIRQLLAAIRETFEQQEGETPAFPHPDLIEALEQHEQVVDKLGVIQERSLAKWPALKQPSLESLRSMEEQVVATLERYLVDKELLAGDDMAPVGSANAAAVLHRLCAAALVALSRICLLDAQFDRALESSEAALRHHNTSVPALKCRNEALAGKGYQIASSGERTAFIRPARDAQQDTAL